MKRKICILNVLIFLFLVSSCGNPTNSAFEYEIEKNAEVAIVRYNNSNETNVIIPGKLDGKPVTILKSDAFYQNENAESIFLPQSLTTIEGSPFYRCYSLKEIHIPAKVKKIDSNPFFRCSSLTQITVATDNLYYTELDGVLFNKDKTQLIAYPEGKTDRSYIVPLSVRKMDIDAFGYHPNLKEVTILSNVEDFPEGNMFVFPNDIKLYVEAGSMAERYAKSNDLNFELISPIVQQSVDGSPTAP